MEEVQDPRVFIIFPGTDERGNGPVQSAEGLQTPEVGSRIGIGGIFEKECFLQPNVEQDFILDKAQRRQFFPYRDWIKLLLCEIWPRFESFIRTENGEREGD